MATRAHDAFPELRPVDRLRAMLGVVVVGLIVVVIVGRSILVPVDPLGCASAVAGRWGWWIIPASAVLGALLAALLSLISGGRQEEMGVFGVALGFALAALRYNNAAYLWATFGQGDDELRSRLALLMALEAAGWFAVVAAAYLSGRWTCQKIAAADTVATDPLQEGRSGALTVLFMCVIAILLLQILSAGTELAPIATGQVYFSCAAAFYLAGLIAYMLTGAQSPAWGCLAVGVVAVVGYLWAALHPAPIYPGRMVAHFIHFAPTAIGRALPVELIMIGTAGAIFGNWHQRQFAHYGVEEGAG